MAQQPLSILIAGAGVAGVSLALTLALHPSFKVKPNITLVERSLQLRTTGQAIDIRGPAVDVIRQLGLEPDVKARHTSETGLAFTNAQGNIVAQFDATGDAKNQGVTSEYEILRGDLVGLLLERVEQAKEAGANLDIVYGERIEALEDNEDGVDVKFKYGKLPDQTFDAVIATDGSGSKTRSMIFDEASCPQPVKPSGWYVAFFTIPRIEGDDNLYRWCTLPNGLAMHLRPHRNKTTMGLYLAITNNTKTPKPEIEDALRSDVAAQKAYLRKQFQGVGWQSERFLDALDTADDFYMTHWCKVTTPKWTKERCAILGDAAFATMGIGTSLAMAGAYVMAGELSKIGSSKEVATALQSYENIYRPFVAKHEWVLPGMPQLMCPQTTWGVNVLHTSLRVAVALRIPKIMMAIAGGGEKKGWELPEYGWSQVQVG